MWIVRSVRIDDIDALFRLAQSATKGLTSLQLDLGGNTISDAGAKDLAAALGLLTQLTSLQLNLHQDSMGDAGGAGGGSGRCEEILS